MNIKQMIENGFAVKRIAKILKLNEKDIKSEIIKNNWVILKQNFCDDKIEQIVQLYLDGVSAKNLGIKFGIDKRRIQRWVKEKDKNLLRNKNDSHRLIHFNQNFFDEIDTIEKAYWLGFFYADVYNCNSTNTVSLSLQARDLEHIKKLCKLIEMPEEEISYTPGKHHHYTLKMYSKHMCQTLNQKGCPQAKSFIIKFPEWIRKDLKKPFLAGMFDGDGCLSIRKSGEAKWSIVSTKECAEYIKNYIMEELQITISIRNISKTNNNTYELEKNGNAQIRKLMNWLYDGMLGIALERKYNKYIELKINEPKGIKILSENYK